MMFEKANHDFKKISDEINSRINEVIESLESGNRISISHNDLLFIGNNHSYKVSKPLENKINKSSKHSGGIYFFKARVCEKIKINYDEMKKKWKEIDCTPNIVKSRFEKHSSDINNAKLFPFYIGKTKTMYYRLNEHITAISPKNGKIKKGTFALRLAEHHNNGKTQNFFKMFEYEVFYLEMNIHPLLLEIIESELRKYLNPVIGRQ